ncbi:MAG: hypothetical protein K5922_02735 [Clostridiales bacterium]|nr:hypothetical protein [Clostridiales bacterium]
MRHSVWKWAAAAMAALLVLVLAAGASAEQEKKYTVMMYICGADLERDNGQESASMADVLASRYNTEAINVIGLLGGTPRWSGNRFDPSVLNIVNVGGRRPTKVDELALGAMSDPATLTTFLSYCAENYPAEHYILVICDHGGGPLLGCCVDYLFERSLLSVNALSQALADSPFADRGLDTIAFDCCLMGSLEISNRLAPYAKYLVATEDSMYGMNHDWLTGMENDGSELETAQRIADSTYRKNRDTIAAQKAVQLNSVSVIDLVKIPAAIAAMDRYFAERPQPDKDSFTAISHQRRDAVAFGITESGGNSQYDLVDVGSLVSGMDAGTESGAALMEALAEAIPFHEADVENCAGLTVYHPYTNRQAAENSMEIYAGLGFAPSYVDYVINYTSIMTGKPLASWAGLLTGTPGPQKDNRTLFTLKLTEEQAAHFSDAKMKVLWRNEEGSYSFAYVNNETAAEDGTVTGEFNGVALFAVDAEGNALTGALPYSVAPNGIVLIPAELTLPGEEGAENVTHRALIYCELDRKTKDLTPGGVAVWDEVMGCWTGSFQTAFSDYSEVKLTRIFRKETRNAEDVLLPFDQWEQAGELSLSLTIGEGWSFRMLDITENAEDLYASFEVQDSQGNLYASGLHQIRPAAPAAEEVILEYNDEYNGQPTLLLGNPKITVLNQLVFTVDITNLTEREGTVTLEHLTINGKEREETETVYGAGPNWGLMGGETQMLNLMIPLERLAEEKQITSMTFDLTLKNAENEEEILGVIPVRVSLLLDLPEAK